MLRDDVEWADLRKVLSDKGFTPDKILLVSFCEDEEEFEYGVFITEERKIYEYKRSTSKNENSAGQFYSVDCSNDSNKKSEYPQIEIALQMLELKKP